LNGLFWGGYFARLLAQDSRGVIIVGSSLGLDAMAVSFVGFIAGLIDSHTVPGLILVLLVGFIYFYAHLLPFLLAYQ
jgi:hypothetical protein